MTRPRPKRKPAKTGECGQLSGDLRILMQRSPELGRREPPITRTFLIRLAAAHAALIVSRAEGRAISGYVDRFADVIADAVRNS